MGGHNAFACHCWGLAWGFLPFHLQIVFFFILNRCMRSSNSAWDPQETKMATPSKRDSLLRREKLKLWTRTFFSDEIHFKRYIFRKKMEKTLNLAAALCAAMYIKSPLCLLDDYLDRPLDKKFQRVLFSDNFYERLLLVWDNFRNW